MTDNIIGRRRVLRRSAGLTAAGAAAVALGATFGADGAAAGGTGEHHPVVGCWRSVVTLPHEIEIGLFTFLPGGFFLSFAEGIHIATGRWAAVNRRVVRFSLWQVLPDDLRGLPHRYNGEVQAKHEAHVDGDRLTSVGTARGLDIDGNETLRATVTATAVRFGVNPF
jgi:hypothetical protein